MIAVSLFASHFMLPGIITRSMTDSALSLGKMWDMSGVEISHRQNYAPDICRQAARWQNIAFGHVSLDCCLNKAMVHRVFGTFYALNSSSLGACCCLGQDATVTMQQGCYSTPQNCCEAAVVASCHHRAYCTKT